MYAAPVADAHRPTWADAGSAAGAYRDALGEGAPETRRVFEDHGGKLVEIYLTRGQYDSVAVMQFPNAVASLLPDRQQGNSRPSFTCRWVVSR